MDVKSAGWDLWLSVGALGVCCYITTLQLSYHIPGGLSFALKQLKVQTWKLTLLYLLAPGVALWEICFAVSWS